MDLQGTVRSYDADQRSGSVFLDDGATLLFDAEAFDRGGLRLLRPGQRVRVRVDDRTGVQVSAITLATFAWGDETPT